MVENIAPDIYRIEVPLKDNPLKSVNSYVIKSPDRALIIDTAMNRPDCLKVLRGSFKELGVDPANSDYFVSHRHGDHHGLITTLAGKSSRVYMGRVDLEFMKKAAYGSKLMLEESPRHGFPRQGVQAFIGSPPGRPDSRLAKPRYHPIDDGAVINVGGRSFRAIATPGHSQGHMVLYEPKDRILISGDHILGTITPNISGWFQTGSPLHDYLSSLDKVYPLAVKLVLPGHRAIFRNFRTRINEIKRHHRSRGAAILRILREGRLNGYEVASLMKWDLSYENWDDFPKMQQWFATGEALAHLLYLEKEGQVKSETAGDVVFFSIA